jgi:threonine/homoserine/homoserine lactone efflux protein
MILSAFILFAITFIASSIGSLQLGPVNSIVMRTALRDYRASLLITLGGILPEAVYSALALLIVNGILADFNIPLDTSLTGSYILLAFGLYYITEYVRHPISSEITPTPERPLRFPIATGFLTGIANPQLIIFWIGIIGYAGMYVPIHSHSIWYYCAVMLGSSLGAAVTDFGFAYLVHKYKYRILSTLSPQWIDLGIGTGMILVGLYQYLFHI